MAFRPLACRLFLTLPLIPLLSASSLVAGSFVHTGQSTAPLPRPVAGKETAKIRLGRLLFSDRRLSQSGTMSCASCHDLNSSGASRFSIDRGDGGRVMRFNTPTIFNAAFNHRLNWEGRTQSMPVLVKRSFQYTQAMVGGRAVLARLDRDRDMAVQFRRVFGRRPNLDDAALAISTFLETLATPDAPMDRWLRGDRSALTPQQLRGYARFKSLGCSSCHQGVQWGGNLFQKPGVYRPLTRRDPGALRVPSLRNVAVTAPYFHDGSAGTLEEAIARMGYSQLGVPLSRTDIAEIAAFLEGLTGTYMGRRLTAPRKPQ